MIKHRTFNKCSHSSRVMESHLPFCFIWVPCLHWKWIFIMQESYIPWGWWNINTLSFYKFSFKENLFYCRIFLPDCCFYIIPLLLKSTLKFTVGMSHLTEMWCGVGQKDFLTHSIIVSQSTTPNIHILHFTKSQLHKTLSRKMPFMICTSRRVIA